MQKLLVSLVSLKNHIYSVKAAAQVLHRERLTFIQDLFQDLSVYESNYISLNSKYISQYEANHPLYVPLLTPPF